MSNELSPWSADKVVDFRARRRTKPRARIWVISARRSSAVTKSGDRAFGPATGLSACRLPPNQLLRVASNRLTASRRPRHRDILVDKIGVIARSDSGAAGNVQGSAHISEFAVHEVS